MDAEDRALLRGLLTEERLLALGLVVDGEPVVGLLPFAPAEDLSALYVQASGLARHSRGLTRGGALQRGDPPAGRARTRTPCRRPGWSSRGWWSPSRTASARRGRRRSGAILERFPSAAMTLALPDFKLYRLEPRGGRLIGGFGRALNLSASHFDGLASA